MSQPLPAPPSLDKMQEMLASLDNMPLFMSSLPDAGLESNDALEALQSLVHDGTPDEVATNFKNQGNDYFKGKRYKEAVGFYTQGIEAEPEDKKIMEVLLCNRAACNLELKNFGMVLKDCSKALGLNPQSSKAFYRSAMALGSLERYEEALDCCNLCLGFDVQNAVVRTLRDSLARSKALKEKKERERDERVKREAEEKRLLAFALKQRHLYVVPPAPNASPNEVEPSFDPEDPTKSTLIVPVFFLYPQHATSDAIPSFLESTTFTAHLSSMFPPHGTRPDWDTKGEYVEGNLVVYVITRRKRLLKVGRKMTLGDVFERAGRDGEGREDWVDVKEGCVGVVVLPKGEVEGRHSRLLKMSQKILRSANAPTTAPDEFELSVAQALVDLENNVPELKTELRALQISAAREVDVKGGKKAIVVFVPVPQLKAFRKVQQRLTRELEKKFSDRHVVFVAQRRVLPKPTRNSRVKQKRPRSRTLTSVHERVLEDLVFPTEIVGKRTRVAVDGSKLLKVFLDSKDATSLEYKLDSFSSVYRRLTGKDVVFEFPVVSSQD
ncbi:40S ribosomal protein S7 [Pterulicium gracile]|uniref:40S ribosomal protein S7 n=1 Tax=Pterulicium gracile TaxID=1884261 RepID=A0A5C3QU10_9AGAR|nr:40S ribosomal protein S7 [Pterula gracilis]